MSGASLLLSLSVTKKPELFPLFTVLTPLSILHTKPVGASLLQIHILMYPSFHTFYLLHTTISNLGLPWNVHPSTGENSYYPKRKFLPKASGPGSLGYQACMTPGGAAGGMVLLRPWNLRGTELPCKCTYLHNFLALRDSEVSYPIQYPCQDLQVKYWDWLSPFAILPPFPGPLLPLGLFLSFRLCVTKFWS